MDVDTPSISTTPREPAAAPPNTQDASPTRPPQPADSSFTAALELAEASTSKQDAPQANGVTPAIEGESKKRAASSEEGAVKDGSTTKDDGSKGDAEPAKKKRKQDKGPELYCHQDHQPHPISTTQFLTCTGQKEVGKNKKIKDCGIRYCERCTLKRYGENASEIISSGAAATWKCPSCRGICNCSTCRKKQGLDPTGALDKVAAEQGLSSAADVLNVNPGARQAARNASSALSASFGKNGKPSVQALTREGSSPPAKGKGKAKKADSKKVKKEKKTSGNGSDSSLSSLSDSEEEDRTASPAAAGPSKPKPKAKTTPRVTKASSPAPGGAGKAEDGAKPEKRAQAPRAPKDLVGPPPSLALASRDYSSSTLPVTSSLLARLHLREFFLRFLPLMPSLHPSSSKKAPSPQLARVLSALSDDVLWLWSDHDLAAETVQFALLGGLVELLLKEKFTNWTVPKAEREGLKDARVEIEDAKASASGKVRDRPWRTIVEVLKNSGWVGEGRKWRDEWKKAAGEEGSEDGGDDGDREDAAEDEDEEMKERSPSPPSKSVKQKISRSYSSSPEPESEPKKKEEKAKTNGASTNGNGKGKAKEVVDGNDSDDLSSISSASSAKSSAASDNDNDASDDDNENGYQSSSSASDFEDDDGDRDDDDSEVDQLASDYDEEAEEKKRVAELIKKNLLQSKGRRGRLERETPAEERLALCCGLIDMALVTELVRDEMATGTTDAAARQTDLRKKFYSLRHELTNQRKELEASKPPKPAGNGTSEKVKEWSEACEKIEEEIENAEIQNTKDTWHNVHDQHVNGIRHQIRFAPVGSDALGNSYYLLSPPPKALLANPSSASTSGFPLHHKPSDDGKKDYPLSFAVVVHGKRPVTASTPTPPPPTDAEVAAAASSSPQRAAKTKGKGKGMPALEKGDQAEEKVGFAAHDAEGKDEWWIVRGIEEIDALAEWTNSTLRFAEYSRDVGQYYLENPPGKTNTAHKTKAEINKLKSLVPSPAELEKRRSRVDRADVDLSEAIKRFASFVRWKREEAAEETEGNGARRVLRGQEE